MEDNHMPQTQKDKDQIHAGTGFMISLPETMKKLEDKGYTKNLSAKFDHLECDTGKYKISPKDFTVDEMFRFDNASDPGDQSAMYAISSEKYGIKGIFIESYGQGQSALSEEMLEKFKDHNH